MTFSLDETLHVAAILREAARAEILPRFRNLRADEVRPKSSAVDLVTDADEAAERFIAERLLAAHPGAIVVGEEGASREPGLVAALATADLAFVVDPVDGTLNFAGGLPLFGVMAGVVRRGEVVAGVIYDPLGDDWAVAVRGGGAFLRRPDGGATRLRVAEPVSLEAMVGALWTHSLPAAEKPAFAAATTRVALAMSYRCAAHEYRLFAGGHAHFLLHAGVKPWDHAAGSLLVAEAGGVTACFDGTPYRVDRTGVGLISAVDRAGWSAVRDALVPASLR